MPRTPEQFNKIREQRKSQIMNVALDLFSKEGYAHVSIASLAKKAGISKGLLYNYFASKEELLKEILDSGFAEISEYFDPNHDGELSHEEFELFIRKTFSLMRNKIEFYVRFIGLFVQPNVREYLKNSSLVSFYKEFMQLFYNYFKKEGFEDPMLEVLNLAVLIEGLGVIIIYSREIPDLPKDIFMRFEERLIKQYVKK